MVAPLSLENAVLKELPIASEAVVIGKGREYLTCLITLEVSDKLSPRNVVIFLFFFTDDHRA